MPKHKFPLPEARFLVVGDGPLEFFVTRAQAERHVDAGGRWAGKVHCHNSGELRLVDSDGKCEHCRAGGQCEPCWAKVIERLDPVERFHNEQLESVLRPIPLEERLRLYARIWNEAIINFITAVRIECAPPMGTMPDGAIRAGVVFGPPPRPGDVRNLDWIKRLPRNGTGGIPDADVILRDLTKRAVTAKAKLIHCLNNAFEEEPWTSAPNAWNHIEWDCRTYIENVLHAAHAALKPKEGCNNSPEAIEAAAPKSRIDRRVTSHSRRRPNSEPPPTVSR